MAYLIYLTRFNSETNNIPFNIAIDDASLDKVCPIGIPRNECSVVTVTEEQYNNQRLGTKSYSYDGTNISEMDLSVRPGAPTPSLTNAELKEQISFHTSAIREYFDENQKIDKDDWLAYADSVDALDFTSFTADTMATVIEEKGITILKKLGYI